MATIVINVESDDTLYAEACREVANLIDQGYSHGTIGMSGDTWYIE